MSSRTDRAWSRAPLGDLATAPLTPLSWSLLRSAGDRALRLLAEELELPPPRGTWLSLRDGLPGANLDVLNGFVRSLLGTDTCLPWRSGTAQPARTGSLRARWRAHKEQQRRLKALRRFVDQQSDPSRPQRIWWEHVKAMDWMQATLLQVMEEVETRLARALRTLWMAEWGLAWLQSLGGAPIVPSSPTEDMKMLRLLHATATGGQEMSLFLERYGHRAAEELELSHPRWREDDAPVRAIARALATVPTIPEAPQGGESPRNEIEEMAAAFWALRLNARAALGYVADAIRVWTVAAAQEGLTDGRLRAPQDVFLLEIEELKQLLTGEWNVSRRSAIHDLLAHRKRAAPLSPLDPPEGLPRTGWPVWEGTVTGPARVLRRLEDGERIQRGDVLILPSGDPTWGLLFPLAGGVVIECGTPYSAAALLAQAWRLPSVAHVPGISSTLGDDQMVTIDGPVVHFR
ncbi:MAG: hypothetical protein GXP39_04895 [Chloroflexi bacterium]|nr:hypothetical protein [Chloroflexota bacterium]